MLRIIQLCCLVAVAAAYQNYNYNNYQNNYQQSYAPAPQQNSYQQKQQSNNVQLSYAPAPQQKPLYQQQAQPQYQQPQYQPTQQQPRYQPQASQSSNFRQNGRSLNDYYDSYAYDNTVDNYSYGGDYGNYDYGASQQEQPPMRNAGRSSHHQQSHGYKKPATKYVPVVVKKKSKKKTKIITTQSGFYIPGGTQMFGKFADLHSCQKACELTPTCFAGDFNPWVKKCYMHNNLTACASMKTHPQITHFKKVPCTIVETPRGLITLGTQIYKGIEMKGIKSLTECIKKCANLGGGISPVQTAASVSSTPQLCQGLDYDFATHKCYIHTDITLCTAVASILTPKQLVARPSSVNILLCALTTG